MIVEASIVGFVKTLLIIIGSFTVLRFMGRWMTAKREEEERKRQNR